MRLLDIFRRLPEPTAPISAAASAMGKRGAAARLDAERLRRRAMVDQIRADLFAQGRADMTPIDWDNL